MNYKLLILAPSTGGKSTLTRYLREHTDLNIAETDEEVMKANNNVWPDDKLKNEVLVPETTREIIAQDSVAYFASYVPDELIEQARSNGFKVILLDLKIDMLKKRNVQRMAIEDYQDATPWLQLQLDTFNRLDEAGLIDEIIDGNISVEKIAQRIVSLTRDE